MVVPLHMQFIFSPSMIMAIALCLMFMRKSHMSAMGDHSWYFNAPLGYIVACQCILWFNRISYPNGYYKRISLFNPRVVLIASYLTSPINLTSFCSRTIQRYIYQTFVKLFEIQESQQSLMQTWESNPLFLGYEPSVIFRFTHLL